MPVELRPVFAVHIVNCTVPFQLILVYLRKICAEALMDFLFKFCQDSVHFSITSSIDSSHDTIKYFSYSLSFVYCVK